MNQRIFYTLLGVFHYSPKSLRFKKTIKLMRRVSSRLFRNLSNAKNVPFLLLPTRRRRKNLSLLTNWRLVVFWKRSINQGKLSVVRISVLYIIVRCVVAGPLFLQFWRCVWAPLFPLSELPLSLFCHSGGSKSSWRYAGVEITGRGTIASFIGFFRIMRRIEVLLNFIHLKTLENPPCGPWKIWT